MSRYTVVWEDVPLGRLATLWNEHPEIREAIRSAADHLERELSREPKQVGVLVRDEVCEVVVPPLVALFHVSEDDRLVKMLAIDLALPTSP